MILIEHQFVVLGRWLRLTLETGKHKGHNSEQSLSPEQRWKSNVNKWEARRATQQLMMAVVWAAICISLIQFAEANM